MAVFSGNSSSVFIGSNLVLKFYLDMQLGHFWIALILPDKMRPWDQKIQSILTSNSQNTKKSVMKIGQNLPQIWALTGIASFKSV